MNEKQASRLLTLAYFLKTEVSKDHYDQNDVLSVDLNDFDPEIALFSQEEEHCGSVACSIGYLPIVFPGHFEYRNLPYDGIQVVQSAKKIVVTHAWYPRLHPKETQILGDFFGLSASEIGRLFGPGAIRSNDFRCDRTPKQQAKRIENTVIKNGYDYVS